jgi:hypothetical protein
MDRCPQCGTLVRMDRMSRRLSLRCPARPTADQRRQSVTLKLGQHDTTATEWTALRERKWSSLGKRQGLGRRVKRRPPPAFDGRFRQGGLCNGDGT